MTKTLKLGNKMRTVPIEARPQMTEADMNKISYDLAVESVEEWMARFITSMESNVRDLKRHVEDFKDAASDPLNTRKTMRTPIDVLSWFMNDINNGRMQGRLDMAVKHGAELATAINALKREAKNG